jgi:hypothetical protein
MPILAILVKPLLLLTAVTALLGSSVLLRQSFDPPDTAFATFTVLTEADGEVRVGSQDDFEQGHAGQSLNPGDTIRTGANSSAAILFFDGSTVEMDANTEISLKDLLPPQGDSGLSISFTQNFGSTLNRVVSLSSPADSYEVDTPSGVASVRGTVFWVTNTDASTLVEVDEGVVVLQAGNGKEIQVRRGQAGMVVEGGDPFYVNADGDFTQTSTPPPPVPPANPIARQNAAPTSQVAGVVQSGGEEDQQQAQQLPQGGVPQNDDEALPPPPPPVFTFSPQQPPPPGGPFDDGNNGHGNDPPTGFDPSNPGNGGPNGGGGGNGNGNGNGNGPNK